MNIGAEYLGRGTCVFNVWTPGPKEVHIRLVSADAPAELVPMSKGDRGYWRAEVSGIRPDMEYFFRLDGQTDRPDPAAHRLPHGVHGPARIVDHAAFAWSDQGWPGIPIKDMVLYELHPGAFTPEGTYTAIIPRLDDLADLGVNTVSLTPAARFPGERNWGYDGVGLFAVQDSYGGPDGLKALVNECHRKGLAVVLDVVYNHLGPEGNYLEEFGPYFTDRYKTPWGKAVNFDGPHSDEVRNFFIQNALHWLSRYHLDGLRLDAVHAIFDMSARPFLQHLADEVARFCEQDGRKRILIAESDLNDSRIIRPKNQGGRGLDAQWCDDLHHSLHALLTGEDNGYYQDFGKCEHLVKSYRGGYVYTGQFSAFRNRSHGNSTEGCAPSQFIVFSQNHDQVGNRMLGERLNALISFEALKLAAGAYILSPFVPMIFMGEEYAEPAPFLYFVNHGDKDLIRAVREGRKREFKPFAWKGEPPDPQSPETFQRSKLNWDLRNTGKHRAMLEFYRALIRLKKQHPAFRPGDEKTCRAWCNESKKLIFLMHENVEAAALTVMNFNESETGVGAEVPQGHWRKVLDSAEEKWLGPGPLLPDVAAPDMELTMPGLSIAFYQGG